MITLRVAAAAILAAAGLTTAAVVTTGSADSGGIALTVVAETATRITVAWTTPPNAQGYVFLVDGNRVSNTWEGTRTQVTFKKPDAGQHTYKVEAVTDAVAGSVTSPAPVPTTTSTSTSTSTVTTTTVTTTTTTPPPGTAPRLGLWHLGSSLTGFSNLDKYSLVVVSGDGAAQARTLTNARTLIYSNASSIVSAYTEGLSYATASANGCLLGQASAGRYVFDHTKASCNQIEADADVAYVKQVGLKGLFLDDTVPQNPYNFMTPAGWEQGMVTFVHLLHSELAANGLYLLTNANAYADQSLWTNGLDATGDLAWAKMLAPDGVLEENWAQARNTTLGILRQRGPAWNQEWDAWEALAAGVQAAGIDFVGLTYNPTAAAHTYGAASTLLVDAGRAYVVGANADGSDPWGTWADAVLALGPPIGPPVGDTSTVTKPARAYQHGSVTVDPVAVTASAG